MTTTEAQSPPAVPPRGARSVALSSLALMVASLFLRIASMAKYVVLARLLSPSDIGAFTFAAALLGFLEVTTGHGLRDYVISARAMPMRVVHTVWTLLALRGVVISLGIVVLAKPVAALVDQPGLAELLLWLAPVPALRGIASLGPVLAQRDLRMGPFLAVSTVGQLAEVVLTIAAAVVIGGPVAMALGVLGGALVQLLLGYAISSYVPRLHRSRGGELPEILRFGGWRFASSTAWYVSTSGDDLILGAMAGTAPLGTYRMGWQLANTPHGLVSSALEATMLPALSTKVRQDGAALHRVYSSYVRLTALCLLPVSITAAMVSEQLVTFVFGDAWAAAAPLFAILVISGALRGVIATGGQLFIAGNRPRLDATMQGLRAVVLLGALVLLVPAYAATGAAVASLLSIVVVVPLWLRGLPKVGVDAGRVVRALAPVAGWIAVTGAPLFLLSRAGDSIAAALGLVLAAGLVTVAGVLIFERPVLRSVLRRPGRTAPVGPAAGEASRPEGDPNE